MRVYNDVSKDSELAEVTLEWMKNSDDRVLWRMLVGPHSTQDSPGGGMGMGGIVFGGKHGPLVLRCDKEVRVHL